MVLHYGIPFEQGTGFVGKSKCQVQALTFLGFILIGFWCPGSFNKRYRILFREGVGASNKIWGGEKYA
jgi:hypothetical protein